METPHGGLLYEELFRERFSQGAADADGDQRKPDEDAADQRVRRPEIKFEGGEGEIQEKLKEQKRTARGDDRASEDVKISFSDVTDQGDDRCDDDAKYGNHGECQRHKPTAARLQIDKEQVKGDGGKIAGDEDDGIRL